MATQGDTKYATKGEVKRLNDFMALVVMVLLIGFLILVVTLALDFINAMRDDTSSRNELTHQVEQLQTQLYEQKISPKNN